MYKLRNGAYNVNNLCLLLVNTKYTEPCISFVFKFTLNTGVVSRLINER